MAARDGTASTIRPSSLHARLAVWIRRASRKVGARDAAGRTAETLESYKKIIDVASAQAKIGLWDYDLTTSTLRWSEGVYALFELPPGSAVTRAEAVTFYHPESCREMETLRDRAIREGCCFSLDARIRTAKGNERWMRLTANVECKDGIAVRLFGMKQDITEDVRSIERLRKLAETDLLTGLGNRGLLKRRLDADNPLPAAIFLVDLDAFKQINDTFGHPAGDECLIQVASRLRSACPENALLARLGGDEFAVVVEDGETDAIERLANRLLEDMRRPTLWRDRAIEMSVSIGIARPDLSRVQDISALLHEADLALYAAKAAGRDTSRTFVPGLDCKDGDALVSADDLPLATCQADLFTVCGADPSDALLAA